MNVLYENILFPNAFMKKPLIVVYLCSLVPYKRIDEVYETFDIGIKTRKRVINFYLEQIMNFDDNTIVRGRVHDILRCKTGLCIMIANLLQHPSTLAVTCPQEYVAVEITLTFATIYYS